jgi:hypothetical protein
MPLGDGIEVTPMSNLSDFFNAINGDSVDAIGAAGGLIGVVSQLVGAASGAISIFQWFTTQGQPSNAAIGAALAKLQADVQAAQNAVDTGVAALGLQSNYKAVDDVMDDATGVFGTLPTIDPNDETSVSSAITTCYTAMAALRDDTGSKWTVPFADGASSYSDTWSGSLFPPHSDVMFSYTYALPQFIRSISFFIAVIAALKPAALADYTADLVLCANRLQTVHDTILSAIVPTKIPLVDSIAYASSSGTDFLHLETDWSNSNPGQPILAAGDPNQWPFGAVEEYSGANIVSSYWPYLPFQIEPGTIPDNFIQLLQLRIEDRKKTLYMRVGLPAVRQTIHQLHVITGQPPSSDTPYEARSFKEVFAILGVQLPGSWGESIVPFLRAIPPYSGGLLFPGSLGKMYPPSALPKSFRSLFAPP